MDARYYMMLLEGRAKRLNELLEVSAPVDMICNEIKLLVYAAQPLKPAAFKSWSCPAKKGSHEPERLRVATG